MKEKTARLFALLSALCLLFLAACAGAEEAERTRAQEQEALLKSAESYTKVVNILGKNYLYFAQNSPEWTQLFSQEGRKNNLRFGDSGCAIAAFANATVNVLPMERLSEIAGIMQSPVYVDTFCLARRYGKDEDRFLIDSDADRLRFWPLVVANMAAGNNTFRFKTDRSPGFYKTVLDHFGLRYLYTPDVETTLSVPSPASVTSSHWSRRTMSTSTSWTPTCATGSSAMSATSSRSWSPACCACASVTSAAWGCRPSASSGPRNPGIRRAGKVSPHPCRTACRRAGSA